ncbi:site-specific DNA-methyltransferase [Capnocytophaga genosp. AHN8471]|uniref:DNA methyltransferase n=1 Tax=Capnocytophaga genosp. AHN8471 TaxID=327574 RepID=UPI0019312F38|nr:DNA methyltransferase [Capnocytophaga genosp. AHN8471]MBM0652426.1 site-specific DNA-methyltransferase [Capnocytophaga genosp. AHN8471]
MNFNIDFNFTNADTTYLTHSLHPYPAKFPPQLPHTIIKNFAPEKATILDPFCGSGTTLVEARLLGHNAIGVDVNALSILLSKVKATPLTSREQTLIKSFLEALSTENQNWKHARSSSIVVKQIEGLDHWFQHNVAQELTHILNLIAQEENQNVSDFLKIVLSSIIVRVSNQESDTRFAAKNKNIPDNFTFEAFLSKAQEYLVRITEYSNKVDNNNTLELYNTDSRNLSMIDENSIDMIITSPPYANTYDYYLYHKFRKRWLDLDVKFAQYNEIGSRREYSSLKKPASQWTDDLVKCFKEMYRLLKPNTLAFIVIGDSVIKKELIKIDEVISNFAPNLGFQITNIISSDLAKHSRIFNPSFAQKDKKEHLIILKK